MPDMIPTGWRSHKLRPIQFQNVNNYVARRAQTIVRKEPLWMAEFTSTNLNEERLGEMQGFFDKLDGAVGTFLVFDPRKKRPRLFAAGQAGSPNVTAVDYEARTVTISAAATSGLVLTAGDRISYVDGERYCYHRVTTNVTLSSVGATAIEVYPAPLSLVNGSTALILDKPHCEMMVIESDDEDSLDTGGTYVITAMQIKR